MEEMKELKNITIEKVAELLETSCEGDTLEDILNDIDIEIMKLKRFINNDI